MIYILWACANLEEARKISRDLYCARLETWNFERAKTAIIDDRKLVHISNIDQFTIVDYSEFSRGSKSKFQAERSILLGLTIQAKALSNSLDD